MIRTLTGFFITAETLVEQKQWGKENDPFFVLFQDYRWCKQQKTVGRRNRDVGSFQELGICLFSGTKGDFDRISFLRGKELVFSCKLVVSRLDGAQAILAVS